METIQSIDEVGDEGGTWALTRRSVGVFGLGAD